MPDVRLAYETWGDARPRTRSNAVLVLHALTGDSHAAGPAGPGHRAGWWDDAHRARAGRSTPTASSWCARTCSAAARAPPAVVDRPGRAAVRQPVPDGHHPRPGRRRGRARRRARHRPVGLRGRRVDGRPARARVGGVLAGPCARGCSCWPARRRRRPTRSAVLPQIAAIRADPRLHGGDYYDARREGPYRGMGIARRIGQVSYRSELELAARFGRGRQGDEQPFAGGRYAVESYLEYHGEKLVRRFDANTYVGCPSDEPPRRRPRPRRRSRPRWPASRPTLRRGHLLRPALPAAAPARAGRDPRTRRARVIESPYGHDGFLTETPRVAALLAAPRGAGARLTCVVSVSQGNLSGRLVRSAHFVAAVWMFLELPT